MNESFVRVGRVYLAGFLLPAVVLGICFTATPAWSATINVTQQPYNATGNGITDDSTAVSDAIAAAKKGDTVLFPAGTYILETMNQVSVSGISLVGDSSPTLNFQQGGGGFQLGDGAKCTGLTIIVGNSTPITGTGTNWQLTDCVFNGRVSQDCLVSSGTGTISGCTFSLVNSGQRAVNITGATKLTIQNNTFEASGYLSGIGIETNGGTLVDVTSNTFTGLEYGVYTLTGVQTLNIKNNIFTSNSSGSIVTDTDTVTFDSNTVSGGNLGYSDRANGTVSVTNNSFDQTPNPIILQNDTAACTISGNTATRVPVGYDPTGGLNPSAICVIGCDTSVKLSRNNLTAAGDYNGILTFECANVTETQNTVNGFVIGIYSDQDDNVSIKTASLSNSRQGAIFLDDDAGSIVIASNQINHVDGQGNGSAAIKLQSTDGASITNNTYTENGTTRLQYFIYDTTGTATLSGNQTNSMLPDNPAQP